MVPNLKPLGQQVIVITGASSGIGLTTAEMAAERGARVSLNSRNEGELRHAVERIRQRGGRATYLVGDVADPDAMDRLANHTIVEFGGFDTWVNNAGIGIYGLTTDIPLADKRRLFDVNFWGVVHGCRSAVRHLRGRDGGAIINIGSVTSDRAVPLLGVYSASKHAVKGYTDALRMELEQAGLPISVSLVKPASINTPFVEHARNYLEAEVEYGPPVYAPEAVAQAILRCAERPTRDIIVGGGGRMMTLAGMLAPRATDLVMERTLFTAQTRNAPPHRRDALDRPAGDGRRYGPTGRHVMRTTAYTRAALSDLAGALPLILVAAGAIVLFSPLQSRRILPAATEPNPNVTTPNFPSLPAVRQRSATRKSG
jgi:short-subunit dehydrogenase